MSDIPPSLVPARQPVHIFFEAFNDLFGILGVLSRSLTSFVGVVPLALNGFTYPRINIPFAETAVLRSSEAELTRWKEQHVNHFDRMYPSVLLRILLTRQPIHQNPSSISPRIVSWRILSQSTIKRPPSYWAHTLCRP